MNRAIVKCKFCGKNATIRKGVLPFVVCDCGNCGAMVSFRDNFGRDNDIEWVMRKYKGGEDA